VAKKTLQIFEARQRDPCALSIIALGKTLERAGVVLVSDNGQGPGVRLRKKGKR